MCLIVQSVHGLKGDRESRERKRNERKGKERKGKERKGKKREDRRRRVEEEERAERAYLVLC